MILSSGKDEAVLQVQLNCCESAQKNKMLIINSHAITKNTFVILINFILKK